MGVEVIHAGTDGDAVEAAYKGAEVLEAGGIVAFATETVYGLAALATDADAMARLGGLKSRPNGPFTVHIGRVHDLDQYVRDIGVDAQRLIRRCWPGPVTVILPTGGRLGEDRLQDAGLYDVLTHDDRIAIRCPATPVAQMMLSAAGDPVVATSANLAGQPSPHSAAEALEAVGDRIDLMIDSGTTEYGRDSTIVRFEPDGWQMIREGAYDERTIRKLTTKVILFVCTGNTCRSPMASGLARIYLADRIGCAESELADHGILVISAGLRAVGGHRAASNAISAARQYGADISQHVSRKLTIELISSADAVFCMTESHAARVRRMLPAAVNKVRRLCRDGDISDPIGGDRDFYHHAADRIQVALMDRLGKETL